MFTFPSSSCVRITIKEYRKDQCCRSQQWDDCNSPLGVFLSEYKKLHHRTIDRRHRMIPHSQSPKKSLTGLDPRWFYLFYSTDSGCRVFVLCAAILSPDGGPVGDTFVRHKRV